MRRMCKKCVIKESANDINYQLIGKPYFLEKGRLLFPGEEAFPPD